MRQKRKQAGYGLKYVVIGAVKKFISDHPTVFNTREIEMLIAVAMHRDFFVSSVRRAVNHCEEGDFGRVYYRQPRKTIEFIRLMQLEVEKIKRKDAGIIRLHLATHANNQTDQQLAEYLSRQHNLSITRQSVETERQKLCDEIAREVESPDVTHFRKTGKLLRTKPRRKILA